MSDCPPTRTDERTCSAGGQCASRTADCFRGRHKEEEETPPPAPVSFPRRPPARRSPFVQALELPRCHLVTPRGGGGAVS